MSQPPYNPYAAPAAVDAPVVTRAILLERAPTLSRVGAHLIDWAIVIGTMMIATTSYALAAGKLDGDAALIAPYLFMLPGMFMQLAMQIGSGQSIGKRLLGLKVVNPDGTPATLGRVVFLRNVFPTFLGMVCGIIGLIDAFSIFRDGGRTFHDQIANTRVVRAQR